MKKIVVFLSSVTVLMLPIATNAQVGIQTVTPDPSSILDLNSTSRGFLLPRVTTMQRDAFASAATGLMIYNLTTSDIEVNISTSEVPLWTGMKGQTGTSILSIDTSGEISTEATTSEMIPGMTLSPPAGTYLVLFNGQYGLTASEPVSTAQGVIDLLAAYNELIAIPPTNTTHAAVFGNGETLAPGVYAVAGAVSLAGTLTLDAGGDSTALFIIRSGGAFTSGAGTTVMLTNGAQANSIFWIAEGATALAANTIMKGTVISNNAAVSAGAGMDLEGRLFTTTGAIAFGPGTAYVPSGDSYVDLGVLSTFVMFTSSGALANTEPSTITGDVGTNFGAIAGFENINGNVYAPGAEPDPVNNTLVTFSVFQNGVLIEHSSRTSDINTSVMSLQATASVTEGQAIDIRWNVDTGGVVLGNRILSLVKAD